MAGRLYLVATPIGNLGDLSQRARETLEQADVIAAEDTRVTRKLLNHYGIKKPLVSYHEHNQQQSGGALLQRLLAGESCALVSDAGTPVISDPGAQLVADCAGAGIEVVSIPGPCAAISGLILSGLPAGRFAFEGFLPAEKKERRQRLESLAAEERTMIFYEAPHRLLATLAELREAFGDRPAALCRELTKLHEQVVRTTLNQAVQLYQETAPRGEFVLVVGGAAPKRREIPTLEEAEELARAYIAQGLSRKDAARKTAEETGVPRRELYQRIAGWEAE